jgi:hypothetical protein
MLHNPIGLSYTSTRPLYTIMLSQLGPSILAQCCQLPGNVFGQIYRKLRPLAKKFGRTHQLFMKAIINFFYKDSYGKVLAK